MSIPSRPVSGFVPLSDVAGAVELPGGRALTPAAPQARHHFTTLHQVNQLIEASEADADLGFMARLLALCSLPRRSAVFSLPQREADLQRPRESPATRGPRGLRERAGRRVDHDVLKLPAHLGGLAFVDRPKRERSIPPPSRRASIHVAINQDCWRLSLQIRREVWSRAAICAAKPLTRLQFAALASTC